MKILGYDYKIICKDNSDSMGAYGRLHTDNLTIQLATDLGTGQQISTILHEIIEALKYHLGLELPHQSIMSLEAGLFQVLTDCGVDLSLLLKEINDD